MVILVLFLLFFSFIEFFNVDFGVEFNENKSDFLNFCKFDLFVDVKFFSLFKFKSSK